MEAAWAIARRGVPVVLHEMRPVKMTPAHRTDQLAELVCSNSLKSVESKTPAGLLKEEMRALGSLVLEAAEQHRVPGGTALAVDRERFAGEVSERLCAEPNLSLVREEVTPDRMESLLQEGRVVLATGPLTTPELAEWLAGVSGQGSLYFFDAVSPTVDAATIDHDKVFSQSRYDKGGDDYLNCPFDSEGYYRFVDALVSAEQVPLHEFEDVKYFDGCTPIEEIAIRGRDSLRHGNFKPVGLRDPKTMRRPYAVVQLRPENKERTLYSLVACQNRLKWGPQREVLRLIPGLEHADFVRLGVIHRNTYLKAPSVLGPRLDVISRPHLSVAGQLTGVEGYVESAATGILAGISALHEALELDFGPPPRSTAFGSLLAHLADDTPREFAPMNINWGLLPDPEPPIKDKGARRSAKLDRAREDFGSWTQSLYSHGPWPL